MMKKKRILSGLVFAFICCFATACAPDKEINAQHTPITIALTQDLLSFDPIKTSDIFSEAILRCVYTSLYDFDGDLKMRPKLVKNATLVDPYTWHVEIHENVTFHDGSPLTTDDVIFSIERARLGERTQKLLESLDTLKKINDTTFAIRAKEPSSDFLSLFAKAETSIVSRAVVEKPGYDFSVPVGAGPFRFISRKENSKIELERFEDYYLEKAASPLLNFVVLVTEQERTAAFLNGFVDILFSVSAYDCEKLKLSQHVNLLQSNSTKIEYLSLNNKHAPLDNPQVRRAISYAINRQSITNNVYHGYSRPASSLIPQGVKGSLDAITPYNPQLAKEMLTKAGYKDGFSLNVITIDTIRKNTLEYIKLDLAEIGIQLNYNLVTMKQAAAMMLAGEHDSILVGWAYASDPNSVLPLLLGTGSGKSMNSSNYSNPEVDKLMQQGRAESDPEKQRVIYEKINELVTEDAPIIVLQNPMVLSAARKDIAGIQLNPQGLIQYESLYRKEGSLAKN